MENRQLPPRRATESARQQFASTLHMLKNLVDVCPQHVWEGFFFGFEYPFWYQVFHAAFFIDFWFREDYSGGPWQTMAFDARIPPEFEHEVDPALMVSREDISSFLNMLTVKTSRFFDSLDDEKLGRNIVEGNGSYTYADVVFGQIRHVMYNIGYLNGILRSLCLPESDWYSYNEEEPQND